MKHLLLLILCLSFSINLFAVEVPKSQISYMAPWTPHVDVKMSRAGVLHSSSLS